jgi:hypothetical protein
MKGMYIIVLLALMLQAKGQNKKAFPEMHGSYVHPKMELIVSGHRNIAFVGEYGYMSRKVDEYSIADHDSFLSADSKKLALLFYESWEDNREEFWVNCQHPDTTWARLRLHGINPGDLYGYSRQQLAEILGVDAVVTIRSLVFKKYTPAESTLINMASIAATFGLAASGNYTAFFPFQAGVEVFYLSTTVHDASGEMIYLDKGLETAFPKLNPGGLRYMKNQPGFPYLRH